MDELYTTDRVEISVDRAEFFKYDVYAEIAGDQERIPRLVTADKFISLAVYRCPGHSLYPFCTS